MKKTLMIIVGILVGIFVLFIVVFSITSATSKKLVCKSDKGNITIMYDDKKIKGYSANGMSYDLDEQKKVAEKIGIDAYIEEFKTWFNNNTSGNCVTK